MKNRMVGSEDDVSIAFQVPPAILVGPGVIKELPVLVERLRLRRLLLVTDRYLEETGLPASIARQLQASGIETCLFAGVLPDPTVQNVAEGLQLLRAFAADGVIALGGGSPIDAAKAIAVMATNPGPLSRYAGYHQIPQAGVPLIAIPTTAGTGSEATKVAVITDTERNVKMMMLDTHLLPAAALVDYELTLSMPPALTAHVGVDTLVHGMEAYVSRKANAMTDPLALSCVRLVAKHLEAAWMDGGNREARAAMALAACQGGMAFANSSVCLIHGMSRPLGAYFHIPHGLSNAVLTPAVTRFSIAGAPGRYADLARVMGYAPEEAADETAAAALVQGLEGLNLRLEIPRLRQCRGVEAERFEAVLEQMAHDALASGSPQNNPVVPSVAQIVELYRQAW